MEIESIKKSLNGKEDIDRNLIVMDWLRSIRNARTFDEAVSMVRDVYNSGFSDGYDMGTGDYSWDK
jgi:hypothetical protein